MPFLLKSLTRIFKFKGHIKSKIQLKSNFSEICQLICDFTPTYTAKLKLEVLKSNFQRKNINPDKFAIHWQNFTQVSLQLKFAFILRP